MGTSMSRMERSGARSRSVSVWPSGRTNPKTVTSLGTSWAPRPGPSATSRAVTTANRLNTLPGALRAVSTLDTAIGPQYTGARRLLLPGLRPGGQTNTGAKMEPVTKNRKLYVGAAFVAVLLALGAGQALLDHTAAQAKQV